jgi:hypothetical protein
VKHLLEALSLIVLIAIVLGLFLLFDGDPDLWDLLHAKAMAAAKANT